MELSEKIQKLRKDRGLTQEQFAQQLFVSRTAVSKWETGRGTPSMESLQMIARICEVTLDELLGAEEVILVAKNENRENLCRFATYMDGIFNLAGIIGLFLPMYKVQMNDMFYSVPLHRLSGWLAVLYWILPCAMAVCGAIQILTNKSDRERLKRAIAAAGMALNTAAILLLILSGQPYPAIVFFGLLWIKGVVIHIKQK